MTFKVGDTVTCVDHGGNKKLQNGDLYTISRVLPGGFICVVGSKVEYFINRFVLHDPIGAARREVEEAQQRVVKAAKKLADLMDPPVAVGQKRKATYGSYANEILFIDEVTSMVLVRAVDTKDPFNNLFALLTVKAWPIVS